MKTREELFTEFQREFDKKRKWNLLAPVLITSLFLSLLISGASIQDLGYKALFLFIIFFVLLFILVILIANPLIGNNEDEYFSIKKLKKFISNTRLSLINKRDTKYKPLEIAKKEHQDAKYWVDYFYHDPESSKRREDVCSPKENLGYLVIASMTAAKKVQELQKEFDELENQIYELEIKLEFCDQVPEKTYWQYLWSWKWLKRIRKEK